MGEESGDWRHRLIRRITSSKCASFTSSDGGLLWRATPSPYCERYFPQQSIAGATLATARGTDIDHQLKNIQVRLRMLSRSVSQGGSHETKLEGGAHLRAAGFLASLRIPRPIFQPAPVE